MSKKSLELEFLDITEYEAETKDTPSAPLFVINRTDPLGRLSFNCGGDMGKPATVVVANIKIPVDLSMQAPRANLLTSTELRRFLSNGKLLIVSAKSVSELFENDKIAAALYKKAHGVAYQTRGKVSIDNLDDTGMTDIDDINSFKTTKDEVQNILDLEEAGSTDEAETAVLTQIGSFNEADCEKLLSESSSDETKALVSERLTELEAE